MFRAAFSSGQAARRQSWRAAVPATFIDIPEAEAARLRLQYVKGRERRQRYEDKTGRKRHDDNESREGHSRDTHYSDYRFVAWDGEAPQDTGYSLLGSSEGHELCHPHLGTTECLDLLLGAASELPYTIHVWYGGRYDWDEILRQDVPFKYLARLKAEGVVHWKGYRLQEIPGKVYRVTGNGASITLFEIHSWFHKRYVAALRDYGIGTPEELDYLDGEKNRRSEFLWSEIAEIREYMRLELRLMPLLIGKIRDIVLKAGFSPRGWYGPSALARMLLTRNKVKDHMATCPPEVSKAACFGFAGGRFEEFRGGVMKGMVSSRDRNSAYVHAARELPSLAHGTWRRGVSFEPGKFAIYHIRYHSREPFDALRPYPLFRRLRNGSVCWPRRVEGWYWSPEAEIVADDPDATFLESWVFDEDDPSSRPFRFVEEAYRQRLVFKSLPEGNSSREAHMALKWALAAIYGQLARRVGWDKRRRLPPETHQLEWAGYITSHCRAAMYREAMPYYREGRLISIDTDSVTVMGEMHPHADEGPLLGQWETETAEAGVFFQSGIYFLKKDGKWGKGKSRGVEQRRKTPDLNPDLLMSAIRLGQAVRLTARRRYVTVKMALAGNVLNAGKWNESDANTLVFGGGGKRYHNSSMCWKYCNPDSEVHGFIPAFLADGNPFDVRSFPHVLPWKEKAPAEGIYRDTLVIWNDDEGQEDNEEWVAELVSATRGHED